MQFCKWYFAIYSLTFSVFVFHDIFKIFFAIKELSLSNCYNLLLFRPSERDSKGHLGGKTKISSLHLDFFRFFHYPSLYRERNGIVALCFPSFRVLRLSPSATSRRPQTASSPSTFQTMPAMILRGISNFEGPPRIPDL